MPCNGLKISEYDVYWLTEFQLINIWAHQNKLILFIILSLKQYALLILKNKQTNKYKEKLVILQLIEIKVIKVRNKGGHLYICLQIF